MKIQPRVNNHIQTRVRLAFN